MDAGMPGLSMKELQEALPRKFKNVLIIFVSADDHPRVRQIARSFNAAGFFLKPVDGPALVDTVVWAIDSAPNAPQEKEETSGKGGSRS